VRIELLCIGDELLDGRNPDRHAAWFGQRLDALGLELACATLVRDDVAAIAAALERISSRADYLLVSGGLGPTDDDRSREGAAAWVSDELVERPHVLAGLRARYAKRKRAFPEANRRQASFPASAEVLPTEVGTASGFRLSRNGCIADFVPGVPRELYWFVERYALPVLTQGQPRFETRTIRLFGLGESDVADRLASLELGTSSLHYLAKFPEVHLFLKDTAERAARLDALEAELVDRVGEYLVATGDETLVERLGRALIERGMTVATAESCTGGLVGQMLTSVGGSSAWYAEGFVTYTNEAKVARLAVREATLEAHGAVAWQTAVEMARGARRVAGVDAAVALTGIAGPSGGTADKPVGTVWLGLAIGDALFTRNVAAYGRTRAQIRGIAAHAALASLLWYLEDRVPEDWMSAANIE